MTITNQTNKNQYTADGVETNFGYTFDVASQNEIKVIVTSTAGVDSVKTLTTNYTVDTGTQTITFLSGSIPSASERVTLVRNEDITQETGYVENDAFPAAATEGGLDHLIRVDQQQEEKLSRSISVPQGTATTFDAELPTPTGNSDKYLKLNSAGTKLEYIALTNDLGTVSAPSSIDGVSNDGGDINFVAGTNMTITPDDGANTITFDATTSVPTTINSVSGTNIDLIAGTALTVTPDDPSDQITLAFNPSGLSANSISGDKLDGGTYSNFTSTGIDDNATAEKIDLDDVRATISTSSGIRLQAIAPNMDFNQTDGGANEKYTRFIADSTTFKLQNADDTYSSFVDVMSVTRSGTTTATIEFTATDTEFTGTGSIEVPSGTTAQRPSTPANGMVRYNTTIPQLEGYINGAWENLNPAVGEVNTASNLTSGAGTEADVFKQKTGVDLEFRTLKEGSNITLTENANDITISASGTSGEINTATALTSGAGTEGDVFKQKTGVDLEFRAIKQGTNITITENANDITISAAGSVGESNTASNVGGATGTIFKQKTGVDLELKTISGTGNITVTNNVSDIDISTSAEINTASNVGTGAGQIYKQKTGVDLELKRIAAGSGIQVTNGTSDITISATSGGWFNVQDPTYGATGDGTTDDTTAVQAAITAALAAGGTVYFPSGKYRITSELTCTHTYTGDGSINRVCFNGDGAGNTFLVWDGSDTRSAGVAGTATAYILNYSTSVTGDGVHAHDYGFIENLTFRLASGKQYYANGLKIQRRAYLNVKNCWFLGMDTGVELHSSLSMGFDACQFVSNNYGLSAEEGTSAFTSCNAVWINNCTATDNAYGAYNLLNGSYTFLAGTIENNGASAAGSGYGVRYQKTSATVGEDTNALTFLGDTYFEGNGNTNPAKADIWITQTVAKPTSYSIRNCNFNRTANYSTNCILVEHNFAEVLGLDISGCTFDGFGSYTPSAGRPYIDVTTTTGSGRNFIAINNTYNDSLEVPVHSDLAGTPFQASYIGSLETKSFSPAFNGALAYRTSAQSISNSSATTVTWNGTEYDTGVATYGAAFWNSAGRFTIPSGVTKIRIGASASWASSSAGLRSVNIKKNGSAFTGQPHVRGSATTAIMLQQGWSPVINVTAGDYFEVVVFQTSGGSLNLEGSSTEPTWFAIEVVK